MTTALEAGSRPGSSYVSGYTELAKTVRDSGLLKRRYGYYWTRILISVTGFILIWVAVVVLGDSWFQLVCAALLGVVIAQFGFLGHDGAHRQIFNRASWNDWTARILSSVFVGLSLGWWRSKHNRHHGAPNQIGRDPDIGAGVLVFTEDAARRRRSGVPGWVVKRQGWLFFPLLTLEGLSLLVASITTLFRGGLASHPYRRTEAVIVIARLVGYVALLLLLLPVGKASAFFAVQMATFGLMLGASFAPNHKGMPIVAANTRVDFLRRQVLMSRNIRGGLLVDFAMGGLNYQIEHHLFPSMPRPNLRLVQPIVREYCRAHAITYTETGLFESYGIVVRHLNRIGLRGQTTFECPLASQYRD